VRGAFLVGPQAEAFTLSRERDAGLLAEDIDAALAR
jgi:hypothetical protein